MPLLNHPPVILTLKAVAAPPVDGLSSNVQLLNSIPAVAELDCLSDWYCVLLVLAASLLPDVLFDYCLQPYFDYCLQLYYIYCLLTTITACSFTPTAVSGRKVWMVHLACQELCCRDNAIPIQIISIEHLIISILNYPLLARCKPASRSSTKQCVQRAYRVCHHGQCRLGSLPLWLVCL